MPAPVELREIRPADLPVFFEHQRDEEAAAMAVLTPRDHDAFMEHWTKNILEDPAVCARAIVSNGSVVGQINSFERAGVREVGYFIGKDHWGTGIATAALKTFLSEEKPRPLYVRIAAANLASIRVARKCGFVETSVELDKIDDVPEVILAVGE